MPKRVKQSKKKTKKRVASRPTDVNQVSFLQVQLSTQKVSDSAMPQGLSEYMAKIGRKGGLIGGKRRLTKLSQEQRSEIALKAARARWANRKVT